jgi:hypothetical protein
MFPLELVWFVAAENEQCKKAEKKKGNVNNRTISCLVLSKLWAKFQVRFE